MSLLLTRLFSVVFVRFGSLE